MSDLQESEPPASEQETLELDAKNESATNKKPGKRKFRVRNEFIDDEAELSGSDAGSADENESDDDDAEDLDLVDKEARELDSEEEEEIRGLYQKQLEHEDKRALLVLQEQLEEKEVAIGQQRRRKFRWQTADMMLDLQRHYNPDDEDSQEAGEDDDDDDEIVDYSKIVPRLRRPSVFKETNLPGEMYNSDSNSKSLSHAPLSLRKTLNEDSNAGIDKFVCRDKELVESLSTKEHIIVTREEREVQVQREIKRIKQSRSVFDELF